MQYGFYKEKLVSVTKKGQSGAAGIKAMMAKYRENPPVTLDGIKVTALKDYEFSKETDLATNTIKPIDLPKSDVLQFILADGSIISARPSGTEPKIKFYCSVKTTLANKEAYHATDKQLDAKIDAIMKDLGV